MKTKPGAKPNQRQNSVGERIRMLRREKDLSQKELASRSGVSRSAIDKYERGEREPRLDKLKKIACGLDQDLATLIAGLYSELGPDRPVADTGNVSGLLAPSPYTGKGTGKVNPEELIQQAWTLALNGLWIPAEQVASAAAELYGKGSRRWAEIILRHCVQWCQQAGDISRAEALIRLVESAYVSAADPDPLVAGLIENRRGWVQDEQCGCFQKAFSLFDKSLPHAREAADPELLENDLHFRFRSSLEQAMTESHAWLSARGLVRTDLIKELMQASTEWLAALSRAMSPDHPPAHFYKHILDALVEPANALKHLDTDALRDDRFVHMRSLAIARWHLSNNEWAEAAKEAERAHLGYRQSHFPQGISFASAIWAYALSRDSCLKAQDDYYRCLDLLILAVLLHPYDTHPIWLTAARLLQETANRLRAQSSGWLQSYFSELDSGSTSRKAFSRRYKTCSQDPFPLPVPIYGYCCQK